MGYDVIEINAMRLVGFRAANFEPAFGLFAISKITSKLRPVPKF
jgi:hypothetical protein